MSAMGVGPGSRCPRVTRAMPCSLDSVLLRNSDADLLVRYSNECMDSFINARFREGV